VPEIEGTEERTVFSESVLRYTRAHAQHEGYDETYKRFKKDWGSPPLSTVASFDEWERQVNLSHEQLRAVFEGSRVAVFIPLEQVPELQVIAKTTDEGGGEITEDIPLFAFVHGLDADLISHIVKGLGLTQFYYFAVGMAVNGEDRLLSHINQAREMHRDIWGEWMGNISATPVPSQVIDPLSKKPIYFDDYLKRHLPALEEEYFRCLQEVMRGFTDNLRGKIERAEERTLQDIFRTELGMFDRDDVKRMCETLSGFAEWIKEHPGAFKVWLSFLVPAGERNAATLAYYAFAKTAIDYATVMTSKEARKTKDATTLLSFLQERFEHWADAGKKALGLEKLTVPTETLLKVLDKTLSRFWVMCYGWGKIDTPKVSVRMLSLPPLYAHLGISQVRDEFKEVAGVLVDEPLKQGFEKFPQDQTKFYNAVLALFTFRSALSSIGVKALGEQKGLGDVDYDDETLKAMAKRAISKFHNEVSQVVKVVTKTKGVLGKLGGKRLKGIEGYAVATIGFSPADFYSLTTDGTCFGENNRHHPFIIGMLPNSITLRVFVPGRGSVGRAWGVIDPDQQVLYLTNRTGDINNPTLRQVGSLVAATLFGKSPEALEIKDDAKDEFKAIMTRACKHAKAPETPYLNEDAFKISVKE
jgi:hypothetical protein